MTGDPAGDQTVTWQEINCAACGGYLMTCEAAPGVLMWHKDCAPPGPPPQPMRKGSR